MKKKALAVFMAALAVMAVPVGAMAAETESSAEQALTVTLTEDPEYTVTIPASVTMEMREQR